LASFALASGAIAQNWPQWRGPNRDAKAADFKAPATWPAELIKKWQVTVGDGVATPAVVDGKLYVFARQDDNEILRCLNADTGDELWKEAYESGGATGPASGFAGPRASPTVADGKVVTFGARGILVCRDAATGKQLWQKNDFADQWPRFFTSSSPIVQDGICITQVGGDDEGGIVGYDLASGEEKWRHMDVGPAYGSPVLMNVDGANIIVAPADRKLVAVAANDGALLWEMPYEQGRYNSATPIVDGQTLVVAGPGIGLSAFKLKKEGDKIVEEKLWSNSDNSVGFNTPVLKDGLLFGLSGADQLFCLNIENQTTTWSAPVARQAADAGEAASGEAASAAGQRQSGTSPVPVTLVQFVQQQERDRPQDAQRERGEDGRRRGEGRGRFGRGRGGRGGRGMGRSGYGSIVDAGDAILALTPAGELVVFKPTDDAYNELARYKVAEGGTFAYPVATGNKIYVKDRDAVTLWTVD
jgi:outer membrane protein assembly factor BamB